MKTPSLQAVVDAAPEAMVVLGVDGKIAAVNLACLRLLAHPSSAGLLEHEPGALFPTEAGPGDADGRLRESVQRVMVSRVIDLVAGVPCYVAGREPPERNYRVMNSPVVEDGVVAGVLQHITDTTATTARAVQQEHAELIGMVSHDLRNALNAIVLSTSILGRDEADTRAAASVSRILSATARATQLIRDLLDYTTSGATGEIMVRPRPTDVAQLTEAAAAEVLAWFPHRVVTVPHVGAPSAQLDEERMSQAVITLLTQALRRGPREGKVTLRSAVEDGVVVVDVHDEGVIEAADLPTLFLPLQKLTRSGAGRSSGLGLHVASKIAQAHKGMLLVRSVAQQGTHFTLRVPAQSS